MATEASIIISVRRRVADFDEPRKYDDAYYKDAISFSIQKLNHDFGEAYSVASDVPFAREFLLIKLATIEMAFIRAAEGAEGENSDGDSTRFTNIAVPDLSVSDGSDSASRGPSFWMSLVGKLQSEYDGEIGESAGQNSGGGTIEVGYLHRVSKTTGGYANRKTDPGLPAVILGTPSVSGRSVTLAWSRLLRNDFLFYEITRAQSASFAGEVVVKQQSDNHITEHTEENVPAGNWYYRVKTVNPNRIKTNSNSATATVV